MAVTDDARRGATIYSVADQAGVSIATVSRVLQGSPVVSERTTPQGARCRRRPRLPALRRRPQPRRAPPRHLRPGAPRAERPLLRRAARRLRDPGGRARAERHARARRHQGGPRPRACAPSPPGSTASPCSARTPRTSARSGKPVVVIAGHARDGIEAIAAENVEGARLLTEHLLGPRPHQPASSSATPTPPPTSSSATRASSPPTARRGLTPAEPVRAEFRERDGTAVAERLLAGDFTADALVCGNDELALAVMARLIDGGVDVPERHRRRRLGRRHDRPLRAARPDHRPPAGAGARGARRRPAARPGLRRRPERRAPGPGHRGGHPQLLRVPARATPPGSDPASPPARHGIPDPSTPTTDHCPHPRK